MGQRSQIYVTWKNEKGENILIARYFQWNYGERMVSRCSALVQILSANLKYSYLWNTAEFCKKINRVCDVNFDMCDVADSSNIIAEILDQCYGSEPEERNYDCFEVQDNNDGQLFISVDVKNKLIKYGLLKDNMDSYNVMTAEQYMDWDSEGWQHSKYIDDETVAYCKENFEAINRCAGLLTHEEIDAIRSAEYKWEDLLKACGD